MFLSVYLPAQPVTSVQNNIETVITSTEEELIETAAANEMEASSFNSEGSELSYDPSGNSELDELRIALNSRRWDESWVAQIRNAAGKKSFPLHLQFEQVDQDKAFTLSLGELAQSRGNEKSPQYIYPERVKHVLLGVHGICKGKKLSNEIQVCYRRDLAGDLDPRFEITSGRHRLTAIILLLQHLGMKWEKQRIMVSTKVVRTETEFKQLIMDATDSRNKK